MRNAVQKGKCVKQSLPRFLSVCKTYDLVQEAYAKKLSEDEEVVEIRCNVPIEELFEDGEYTSDFVITKEDGSIAVRECVLRKNLLKPRMIKLLDFSQRYWRNKGVSDWKVIINAEE